MFFPRRNLATLIALGLGVWPAATAETSEATIQRIRTKLAKAGSLEIQIAEHHTSYNREWQPDEDVEVIYRSVRRYPPDLLEAACDAAIREGSMEERIGALAVYSEAVYMNRRPVNPEYKPLLLDFLSKDDIWVEAYSNAVVGNLVESYPSRESLLAIMEAADRAPTHEDKVGMLLSAARLCNIELPNIQPESRGPRVEKVLADFEHWFAENKDRIRFTKEGEFRLSGSKTKVKQVELTEADRKRIRQDPGCVLKLMNGAFGGNDDLAAVGELHSRCGAALFGTDGSAAIAGALAEIPTGEGLSAGAQATLSSLTGTFPVADAWILAASYVAARETDPEALEMAKEALIQVGPTEVRRISKGEPRDVVKKAQALANESRDAAPQ